LQWKGGANGFTIEDHEPPPGVNANAVHRQVSAEYLQTMGVTLREGRWLNEHDDAQAMSVMLVNETLARQHWPNTIALGKRVKFGPRESRMPWFTIVGVVSDVRQMGMDVPVKAEMYIPYRQITSHAYFRPRDLVIRTAGEPLNLVAAVRQAIHAVDPDQPVSTIATMDQLLIEESARRRIGMILLTAFAALALLLASLGIYGVLSYFVTQHTPEIGVRLALGAQPRNILRLVLRKGMSFTLLGVGIGIAASLALTRLMQSLLFGVSASDPLTLVMIAILLTVVAFFACWIPARRATKVDPIIALRYE
jgi:predicted permease